MKLLNKISNYTIYRKMIISYIVLVCVTILLLSTILFELFSYNTTIEIKKVSQSMLKQTSYASDVIYKQVFLIGNQLLQDKDVITTMFSNKTNNIISNYKVVRKLKYLQGIYPFIKYFGVYNPNTKTYLNNKGISSKKEQDIIYHINSADKTKFFEFYPREISFPYDESLKSHNVLTFILYSNFIHYLPDKGAVVVNVDEEYIRNTIKAMSNNLGDTIFVIDSQGTVLSHITPKYFLEDFSKYSYIQKILISNNLNGYTVETINGEKSLVTYVKSDNLGWVFISIKPYNQLISNILKLKNITIAITLFLITISILLSLWFITQNLYNPMNSLITEINSLIGNTNFSNKKFDEFELLSEMFSKTVTKANSLESSLKIAYPLLKNTYYNFLLKGQTEKLSDTMQIIKDVDTGLTGPFFCIFIITIDNYEDFQNSKFYNDLKLLNFAICNVAHELIEKHYKNEIINLSDKKIAVLAQLEEKTLVSEILLTLEEIQNVFITHFKASISISIGNVVYSKNSICKSYESALEYLNYRLFFGYSSIIDYNRIKDQLNDIHEYPYETEKKLLKALQLNNKNLISKEIDTFINTIYSMSYNNARIYCNQLLISILKNFDNTLDSKNTSFYNDINAISKLNTLKEISSYMKNFFFTLCDVLKEKKCNQNNELIYKIQEYINNNYSDCNLCIDLVADQVHLSSGYLGKLFKSIINTSFSNYLNKVRLEKAKELLVNTNYSGSVISEKVGIKNNTYFFTLFKKTFGMTPTQYRKQSSTVK